MKRLRLVAMLVVGVAFIAIGTLNTHILSIFSWKHSNKLSQKLVSWVSRAFLWVLNIEVRVLRKPKPNTYFIVANHQGYLDVLAIASCVEARFVTSVDMSQRPIEKALFDAGRCIRVDRKQQLNCARDILKVTAALRRETSVVVFPEATSTNGFMVPFKSTLFEAAMNCSTPVLPVSISYLSVNGKPMDEYSKELMCYYIPNTNLIKHLRRMAMETDEVVIELMFHDPIDIYHSRKGVCRKSENLIKSALH